MRLIEKIKQRYEAAPMKKVEVPEWDTDLYFRPLTTEELDTASLETPEGASPSRSNLQLVILKALDVDGQRVFSNADADVLTSSGYVQTINRIAGEMAAVPSVEEAKKN